MSRQVLEDRIAIITGASRGLGEGIAKIMAKGGAITALFSRDIDLLLKCEKDIRKQGQKAVSFQVDVSNSDQVHRAVKDIIRQFGRVDILVNNAGIAPSMPFLKITDEIRDQVVDINFLGVWNCTKAVLPNMIKKKYGKIINISSVSGPIVSSKGLTIYSASKGAISGFTKSLALEVAEYGITVNTICPGSFDTPMMRSLAGRRGWSSEQEYLKNVSKEIPLGRLGTVHEMGDLTAFLASDSAAYITGTEIVIDGGNVIQEHKG